MLEAPHPHAGLVKLDDHDNPRGLIPERCIGSGSHMPEGWKP